MHAANPLARIIVGYDASAAAETAFAQAIALAEQYGGDIVLVNISKARISTVLPVRTRAGLPAFDANPVLRSMEVAERALFDAVSRVAESCGVPVWVEFAVDEVTSGIIDAANRWDATAVVIGSYAHNGFVRFVLGSTAEELVRSSPLPVIVSPADNVRRSLKRVVVGIDTSEPAANACTFAIGLARQRDVRLRYCTVIDPSASGESGTEAEARDALDAMIADAHRAAIDPDSEIIEGANIENALREAAARYDADAIVVGNHKRGDLERFFLGSTAEALVRQAERPVIVVPGDSGRRTARVLERAAEFGPGSVPAGLLRPGLA